MEKNCPLIRLSKVLFFMESALAFREVLCYSKFHGSNHEIPRDYRHKETRRGY